MVVKTELCFFSGYRVYPGHGRRFIRGDSKPFWFLNGRTLSVFHQKQNPRKLCWTQVYRKLHKKGTQEEVAKKRIRRVIKVERPIVGAGVDVLRAKRNQKPEVRQAAREAALREVKEEKRKKQAQKKTTTKPADKHQQKVAKVTKKGNSAARR
eukprot:c491_g1_i1.p1 GENE.c491_g1_i1~~c491_g1_i1.p1  ORF type:complete len:162 (-),score=42.11 c491_g1_i1:50-508(-)